MNTKQYLDAAKKKLRIESDYALAPHLGLTKQAISKLRNRPLVMSNTTAARIAGILELEPLKVIADAELERGSNDSLWKRIRDAAVIAIMAIGVACFGQPAPVQASTLHNSFAQSVQTTHCRAARRRGALLGVIAFLAAIFLGARRS